MANWTGASRTNYFKVTDEDRYQELFKGLVCEDDSLEDFSYHMKQGNILHGFGSYGTIDYLDPETDEYDFQKFVSELTSILTDDSVFVFTCTGHEKLRYLTGICLVAYPDGTTKSFDLDDSAYTAAREYNPNVYWQNTY